MTRPLVALPLLGLWLAAVSLSPPAPAAPVPKSGGPYFPTRVGTQWVEQVEDVQYTYVVTAAETAGDTTTVSVGQKEGGRVTPAERVAVSPRGVFLVERGGKAVDPSDCLLKLPAVRGETWEVERGTRWHPWTIVRTCRGVEEVEVPAGLFKAVRVEEEHRRDHHTKVTVWHAAGVGQVKLARYGDPPLELKSFELGKD
jgi:hypothetical protein